MLGAIIFTFLSFFPIIAVSDFISIQLTDDGLWNTTRFRGADGIAVAKLFAGEEIIWPKSSCQVKRFKDKTDFLACDFEYSLEVSENTFDSWPVGGKKSLFEKQQQTRPQVEMEKQAFFGCQASCEAGDKIMVKLQKKKFQKKHSCGTLTSEDEIKTIILSKNRRNANGKNKAFSMANKDKCRKHCRETPKCFGFHFALHHVPKTKATCTLYSAYPSDEIHDVDPALMKSFCFSVPEDNTIRRAL